MSESLTLNAEHPGKPPGAPLVHAWARLLARLGPWEWFATFTFAGPVHANSARRRFDRWLRFLQADLYGPDWQQARRVFGHGLTWAVCTEWQRRGVIHFHALLQGPGLPSANRFRWERVWQLVADGLPARFIVDEKGFLVEREGKTRAPGRHWSRIEVPLAGAVEAYCSKYVAKGGELELDTPPLPSGHEPRGYAGTRAVGHRRRSRRRRRSLGSRSQSRT